MTADSSTAAMFARAVQTWCDRHAALLIDAERAERSVADELYCELSALGVTDVLSSETSAEQALLLATALRAIAEVSAGVAALVLARNMGVQLLASAGVSAPAGWLALPLFDGAEDCPIEAGSDAAWRGVWRGVAAAPVATVGVFALATASGDRRIVATDVSSRSVPVMQLGLRACPCGDVTFDGVETPGAALPASTVARIWSNAEALVAAIRAGILRAAQRTSADYALERWQGGKVIIGHSLVRKMLADIAQESEIADALWPDLCAAVSPTGLPPRLVARSLDVAEGLPGVVSQCLQLLGGSGYTEDLPQARRFRDAKQCEFLLGHPQARRWAMAYRASGSGLTTIATRDPVSPEPAGVHGQVPKHA